jgi:hypothetical protein
LTLSIADPSFVHDENLSTRRFFAHLLPSGHVTLRRVGVVRREHATGLRRTA